MNAKLLLDENSIPVLPSAATALGLNEAIVLQQLHFCLQRDSAVELDGRRWFKAGLEFWRAQFPWWSEPTIRRAFQSLRERNIVETRRGREANVYTINYDALSVGPIKMIASTDQSDASTDQSDRSPCRKTEEQREEEGSGDGPATLPGMEPPVKPSPDKVDDLDEKIELVWAHWLEVFGNTMRVKELTPPRRRAFAKALKAVGGDVALMNRAIDGLKSWREKNPGAIQPSTIFETGPNSMSNLTDQIEWWAGHAKTTLLVADSSDRIPLDLSTVPSVTKGTIQERRREVMRMLAHPSERTIRERGEAAVDWLKEHTGHEAVIEDGEFKGWRYVE